MTEHTDEFVLPKNEDPISGVPGHEWLVDAGDDWRSWYAHYPRNYSYLWTIFHHRRLGWYIVNDYGGIHGDSIEENPELIVHKCQTGAEAFLRYKLALATGTAEKVS